jgi:hypothetical protein
MCREKGITDNPAVMLVAWESVEGEDDHESAVEYARKLGLSKPLLVGMVPLIHREDPLESYKEVVKSMPIQKFEYLMLAVEGYLDPARVEKSAGKQDDDTPDEKPNDYKRGDMAKDFSENPFTKIQEGIIISGINWTANEIYNAFSTYRYDDKGIPQFSEVTSAQTTFGYDESDKEQLLGRGRLMDAMVATVAYMNLAVKAQSFHSLMTKPEPDGDFGKKAE